MQEENVPKADRSMSTKEDTNVKSKSAKISRKSTNANSHECHICRKSNMTLSGLKIHLLTHSGEKPYHCTVCDKRFTCSSNLKKHQRIHTKDYIYTCNVCGKTCSDPSNMKKHMTVHSGEKAYVCPSCGKSYSYAQSLRQHMDDMHVANGEKRLVKNKRKGHFPCPECGKVFGYYWRCSLHQARVHATDRPYKCPECGKCFARENILAKHMQTHEKRYACSDCDRRFSFRDQLKKHKRTHNGEKPYQCEICLKSFSQRGTLTEHKRTHTGIKPYACAICGVKFASSSSLRRHERRVKSCLPPPEGEEIPVVPMYPRKTIPVPTTRSEIPSAQTQSVTEVDAEINTVVINETGNSSSENTFLFKNENERQKRLVTQMDDIRKEINTSIYSCDMEKLHRNPHLTTAYHHNPSSGLDNQNVHTNDTQSGKSYGEEKQPSLLVRCDEEGRISVLPLISVKHTTNVNDGSLEFFGISLSTSDKPSQQFQRRNSLEWKTTNDSNNNYIASTDQKQMKNHTITTSQLPSKYHIPTSSHPKQVIDNKKQSAREQNVTAHLYTPIEYNREFKRAELTTDNAHHMQFTSIQYKTFTFQERGNQIVNEDIKPIVGVHVPAFND